MSVRLVARDETESVIVAKRRLAARFIGITAPDYPALLRAAASAPPLIAVRGNLASLRRSKIAIVGARNASARRPSSPSRTRRRDQRNAIRLGGAEGDFPRRNRIVAGLCRAVVVVGAA